MTEAPKILWLAVAAPLAGAAVNGLFGRRLPKAAVFAVGLLAPALSLAVAVLSFLHVRDHAAFSSTAFEWIRTGTFQVDATLRVDALGAVMFLVVTGVGWLIHLYSVGYMGEDEGVARFFSYLNLFIAAMLLLVLADNLALMFVGWEGVGLCSYLLIGFWFHEPERAAAGQKAFVVNRIGDLGFLLGIFLAYATFGTLSFEGIREGVEGAQAASPYSSFVWIALLLFVGACGKSAQIPLHVWLPDAMAGPTPVSALIHAATMVTAGVYMIVRLHFLYAAAAWVPGLIGIVAALTALLAGVIAMGQHNLKKVLAYSTISQLAYMFAGAAAAAYGASMFHLVTHAFFKALLFLTAGAVIHALGNEEDMRKMGGLWKKMPFVGICFAVGGLAMAGPIGGFWSKEAVVGAVEHAEWTAVWAVLVVTGMLTSFYIARAFLLTFVAPAEHEHHVHKPGLTMTVPLGLLAAASVVCSALGGPLQEWLGFGHGAEHEGGLTMPLSFAGMAVGYSAALVSCVLAREKFRRVLTENALCRALAKAVGNKFYVDEIYHAVVVLPVQGLAAGLWLVVDRWLIDGLFVNGIPEGVLKVGLRARKAGSGAVNGIVGAILAGAVLMFAVWLILEKSRG